MYGWYPSTPDAPRSAVTIPVLKLFHTISLQGKTTTYHFFNALSKITNNIGSKVFKIILHMVHQWHNLHTLKGGGMGNDAERHMINLPKGWKDTPLEKRFFYAIFLAIDTCFRLKRKKISSWWADPSIQDGWAYFMPLQPYMEFLKDLTDQNGMSTCMGLAALNHANTKYAQGYAVTGCGMITCGCHEVVCKSGIGDLQKGEKYGNMDYIVASAWRHLRALLFFLLSYDIMGQWSESLGKCLLKQLPSVLRFELAKYFVSFVIPKLHILGHLRLCQEMHSLLFTLGATQADMEGIKHIWSSNSLMGASTWEMGKIAAMGETLQNWFQRATKELSRQIAGLEEFNEEQEGQILAWTKAVDDFETGLSADNPYQLPQSGSTLHDIELELAHEEHIDCHQRDYD
ncbi:C2H2-type domain-containing protein [Mycena sanguinolenta]|uniref:C2H2-type domain-containing protein n=1 Tax=Mycena sanguinolenta TaxID=230812 RepID=A0A8H6ZKE1_9AGAR|nr:C2H2-type domain-containing protein [Mycena sanguinolenta]